MKLNTNIIINRASLFDEINGLGSRTFKFPVN